MSSESQTPSTAPYGPLPAGGRVRQITRWGEPVMHRELEDVTVFDDSLRALAADMVATMYAAEGVGLAANQIGEKLKIFVFDCPDEDGRYVQGVVCNPVLTLPEGKERRLDAGDEGCLSYPGAYVPCGRPDYAAVDGLGLDGEPVHFEGDGLLARCLQHETDHLFGTVFGDRVSQRFRKKLQKQMESLADEYPPGWPAA